MFSFSSQCTTQGKLTATAKMYIEVRWVIALLSCDARLRSENQCMTKNVRKNVLNVGTIWFPLSVQTNSLFIIFL